MAGGYFLELKKSLEMVWVRGIVLGHRSRTAQGFSPEVRVWLDTGWPSDPAQFSVLSENLRGRAGETSPVGLVYAMYAQEEKNAGASKQELRGLIEQSRREVAASMGYKRLSNLDEGYGSDLAESAQNQLRGVIHVLASSDFSDPEKYIRQPMALDFPWYAREVWRARGPVGGLEQVAKWANFRMSNIPDVWPLMLAAEPYFAKSQKGREWMAAAIGTCSPRLCACALLDGLEDILTSQDKTFDLANRCLPQYLNWETPDVFMRLCRVMRKCEAGKLCLYEVKHLGKLNEPYRSQLVRLLQGPGGEWEWVEQQSSIDTGGWE